MNVYGADYLYLTGRRIFCHSNRYDGGRKTEKDIQADCPAGFLYNFSHRNIILFCEDAEPFHLDLFRQKSHYDIPSPFSYPARSFHTTNFSNRVNLEQLMLKQGEILLPAGREKRLGSNHSITIRKNYWYDHATETGGLAIDFVKMYYGKTFSEAMAFLLSEEYNPFL